MNSFFDEVLDWSEVWAPLIIILLLLRRPAQPNILKPVVWFVWLSFIINLSIDINGHFQTYFPEWMRTNNPLYNVLSIVRFICFSIFFLRLSNGSFTTIKKILIILWAVFVIVNFVFFENFFNFYLLSGNLLATEGFLLLVFCLLYYLAELKNDSGEFKTGPVFWVVTGLGIYVVSNFFIFLFYVPVVNEVITLSISLWNIHNIAFIILCIFLTKAFYGTVRNKHRG